MLLTAMIGFCATYVKSLTLIFLPLAPALSPALLGALFAAIVVAVILPGGLLSVVRSDVASFVVTVIALPLLLLVGAGRAAPLGGLAHAFPSEQLRFAPVEQWSHPLLPFWFVTTLIVLTCFTYIAAPWYGQKIFAAKSERTAFAAVAWSAVLVFTLYGVTVLAAAYYRVVRPELNDPQLVLPMMMIDWLPPGVRGVGYAVLFAAAVTTLGGVWTAMAAMIAVDFGSSRAGTIGTQRLVLCTIAVLSWLGATFLVDDILERLILANVPVAALSFALLAGFHWPGATTRGAWASVVVGVLWGAGSYVMLGEAGGYTWTWAMYGIPLIFVTGIVTSLFDGAHAGRSIS
jgi:Na+/proline symporter